MFRLVIISFYFWEVKLRRSSPTFLFYIIPFIYTVNSNKLKSVSVREKDVKKQVNKRAFCRFTESEKKIKISEALRRKKLFIPMRVLRVCVSEVIPGWVHKGVHGVGLPPRRAFTSGKRRCEIQRERVGTVDEKNQYHADYLESEQTNTSCLCAQRNGTLWVLSVCVCVWEKLAPSGCVGHVPAERLSCSLTGIRVLYLRPD